MGKEEGSDPLSYFSNRFLNDISCISTQHTLLEYISLRSDKLDISHVSTQEFAALFLHLSSLKCSTNQTWI